jgi:anaerobic ribonucleoside-triphosphate reductase activating protein
VSRLKNQIRVAGIINESIVDGPGIRMVIFAQGCKHHCKGCHNPQTHTFEGGEVVETEKIISEIKRNPLLDGVTFSGGDPFEQASDFAALAVKVKEMGLNVITYTGYTYEQIVNSSTKNEGFKKLLENSDMLVDGPFQLERKNLMLKFRGSENQRIINVPKSLKNDSVILAEV